MNYALLATSVLGSGFMGSGIAQFFMLKQYALAFVFIAIYMLWVHSCLLFVVLLEKK